MPSENLSGHIPNRRPHCAAVRNVSGGHDAHSSSTQERNTF
ncbi:MAG: ABC transporter [Neisseria sp.]|nr:ABC transporter [Neisseria meningitidis]RKV68622.1 MAG: ABC transporter [Neisseria sp.]MCL5692413.1 ABC transporter [Neisseria meningitidis]MCL5696503.1 ABC transporter [Neisseria meningitidis]MCL5698460.1 ABC transporter [Neisseria meningitidis]